jgi:pyrroloquinoline-quinone synthase
MIDTEKSLDASARRWNLLEHSFYVRWTEGTLTREELADYAGQYAHVVAGLPRWLETAAQTDPGFGDELRRHAREEASHVALWDRFSDVVGGTPAAPNTATMALLERCDALAVAGQGAAVGWALESQTPAVSDAKLEGLRKHYGVDETSGGEYFELHRRMDVEHEAQLRQVVAAQPAAIAAGAPDAAAQVLEGLYGLLTSVEHPDAKS